MEYHPNDTPNDGRNPFWTNEKNSQVKVSEAEIWSQLSDYKNTVGAQKTLTANNCVEYLNTLLDIKLTSQDVLDIAKNHDQRLYRTLLSSSTEVGFSASSRPTPGSINEETVTRTPHPSPVTVVMNKETKTEELNKFVNKDRKISQSLLLSISENSKDEGVKKSVIIEAITHAALVAASKGKRDALIVLGRKQCPIDTRFWQKTQNVMKERSISMTLHNLDGGRQVIEAKW